MEDRATARIVGLSLSGICLTCMLMAALGMNNAFQGLRCCRPAMLRSSQ
jgi:hypothetical protein